MKYVSLFSGIEAASVAWCSLDWEPIAFAEIEPFPSAVLAHHYPDVPNLGDVSMVDWRQYAGVDVLVGGSPCQSFSVAGLRKGLDDPRGNLMLEYLRAVDEARPRWLVWENVPGVLSTDGGRAFGTLLGGLAQIGYGFAYRILDAQYVRVEPYASAVPQRRRRVFVVGYLGDWRRAAAVLLERESLCRHPAPRRKKGEIAAGTIVARASTGGCDPGADGAAAHNLIPGVAHTLTTISGPGDTGRSAPIIAAPSFSEAAHHLIPGVAHTLTAVGGPEDGTGRDIPIIVAPSFSKRPGQQIAIREDGSSFALTAGEPPRVLEEGMAFEPRHYTRGQGGAKGAPIVGTLSAGFYGASIQHMAVRKLTPRECERLQGFPDDWTLVPYRNKLASDGPRYKAIGNSMAINVMSWIGQRIAQVERLGPVIGEQDDAAL